MRPSTDTPRAPFRVTPRFPPTIHLQPTPSPRMISSMNHHAATPARTIILLAALALALLGCAAPQRPGSQRLTPQQQALYAESFDEVWTTVRDKHWDPTLNGVDWDAAKAELRPRIQAASTANQARGILEELLSRLGQSHFGIIPAEVYRQPTSKGTPRSPRPTPATPSGDAPQATDPAAEEEEPEAPTSDRGDLGLELRVIDARAVVFRVVPGSPADAAGIKPGWILTRAGAVDLDRRLAAASKALPEDSPSRGLTLISIASGATRGKIGSTKALEFLDGQGQTRRHDLTLARPVGADGTFGNLVGVYARVETARLSGGVGYIHLNIFVAPGAVMPRIGQAIAEFRDAPGLILDLRGNPGGIGAMAMGIGGWFVSTPNLRLGTMSTRDASINFVLNPRPGGYAGPLAILVDEASASTSEILAGGLKDLGRARVFGVTSAGAALPSVISRLPSGDRFQYAFANYLSVGGKPLEGVGVVPDQVVPLSRDALLRGQDNQIEAALEWLRSAATPAS